MTITAKEKRPSPPPSSDMNTASTSFKTTTATSALSSIHDKVNWSVAFPIKLHRMLGEIEKKGKSDIISWLPPDGKFFKVHDVQRFEEEIMPIYFDSTKYRSFQKNLNMWDFTVIRSGYYRGSCFHPLFMKESVQMCYRMQRRHRDRSSTSKKNKKTRSKKSELLPSSSTGGNGSSSLSSSLSPPPQQQTNKAFTAAKTEKINANSSTNYSTNVTNTKCGTIAAHIHEAILNRGREKIWSSSVLFSGRPKKDVTLNVDSSTIIAPSSTSNAIIKKCIPQKEKHGDSNPKRTEGWWATIKNDQKKEPQQYHTYIDIALNERNKVVPNCTFPEIVPQLNAPLSLSSRNMIQSQLLARKQKEEKDSTPLGRTACKESNSNIGSHYFQIQECDQQQRKLLLAQMALQTPHDFMLAQAAIRARTNEGHVCSLAVGSSFPTVPNRFVLSNRTFLSPSVHSLSFHQTNNKRNIF